MVYRRFGLLKYLTPFVAAAAFVLGCGARAAETAASSTGSQYLGGDADGMSWCRVSAEKVNIRVDPNTGKDPVGMLRSGDYIRAKAVQNNWLEMEWPKNVPAWVLKTSVQMTSSDGKMGTVHAARARIMGLASNNAPEVAVLEHGARVAIVRDSGDWYQVQPPSSTRAYISAKYVVVGVQAPVETVTLPPASKAIDRAAYAEAAEPVVLADSKKLPSENDGPPAEVVIVQHQTSWPKPASREEVSNKLSTAAPAAAKKPADDAMFAAAGEEVPLPAKSKASLDAQTAQAAAAQKKIELETLARVVAAERKRTEESEAARKAAEARKLDIEAQAQAAADRKHLLEVEIAKLSEARKKAEAEELARQAGEKKRLEEAETARLAAEAQRQTEMADQSRLASERKRLEAADKERAVVETRKKAEIETQTKAVAEKKKVLEDELARLSEAKKKAEGEEQARLTSEKKRLAEAETARVAAEAKKAELEEQAQKAAEKKRGLEAEIARLAEAKKKEELEAAARAAREKKLIADAEMARREIEARHKTEQEELARKEVEKKHLDEVDAARAAADSTRRAELAEQERTALVRKKALEEEIARLYAEKRKYEQDALARLSAEKKSVEEAEALRAAAQKKTKAEIDALTKLAAEKKRAADEETARAAAERKRADEAEAARAVAEKRHAEEVAAAKLVAERKQADEAAAQKAAERKRDAEDAAALAAAREAAARKQSEEVAAEKKRLEEEAEKAAAEKRRIEQEIASAVIANTPARLPEPGVDDSFKASKSVALITDRTIMLNESDLLAERGEPTERTYNSGYVPQSVLDIRKKYVVPKEAPASTLAVAETIDVDMGHAAAKMTVAPSSPATVQLSESVELSARKLEVQREPVGPAIVDVNDRNFGAEIDSYRGAVLVDFSATWCGPCRGLAPTIDSLAQEFRGRVKVVKIDLDQAPGTARRFGVSSIPYLMIYKDGKIVDTHLGAPSREFLTKWMQDISDAPKGEAPVKAEAPAKAKDLGMRLIPTEQRTIVSDVGQLDRVSGVEISGVKYVLRNNGAVLRYIIEPSDVDMSPMVGRTISITGYSIGRSYSDVSVIQMKNASTFG